jgi:UDP-N-acetylglucosamine--N-acetylmuramyl-(pentapeptide) pyrophosphoryl-undecaprenol N-acetylglucosamine transferase
MANAALSVGKPDAPEELADMVVSLAEKGRST